MTNKPKLICVTNLYPTESRPYFGTFVKNFSEGLRRFGWDIEVKSLTDFGSGVFAYLNFYISTFLRLLRYEGIVYVHYVSHSAPPVLLAKVFNRRIRLVINYHGSDAFPENYEGQCRKKIKRIICSLANSQADLIVAPSAYFARKLEEAYSLKAGSVQVSYSGGIDTKIFHLGLSKPSLKDGIARFVFASRMIEEKGCYLAVEAAKALCERVPGIMVSFVGDGPERTKMQLLLERHVSEGKCKFHGALAQGQLAEKLRESDFFLFPSYREGESLGLVLIEAMACGALPVAVRRGAVSEILGGVSERLSCRSLDDFSALTVNLALDVSQNDIIREKLELRARKVFESTVVASELAKQLHSLVK